MKRDDLIASHLTLVSACIIACAYSVCPFTVHKVAVENNFIVINDSVCIRIDNKLQCFSSDSALAQVMTNCTTQIFDFLSDYVKKKKIADIDDARFIHALITKCAQVCHKPASTMAIMLKQWNMSEFYLSSIVNMSV